MRLTSMFRALAILTISSVAISAAAEDLGSRGFPEDDVAFELIGQVKNTPAPSADRPATSVQYGYLSYINGLTPEQTFAPGAARNESTALFTFYNDSVTVSNIAHGNWRVITREGTMTVYFHASPHGDLTTPNPETFRDGMPVMVSTWRHQVIFEPAPTGHFLVTFINTITSTAPVVVGGMPLRIGRASDKFRISLVGGLDPAGLVNGKFAGSAFGIGVDRCCEKDERRIELSTSKD